jgi:hypothetical protein
VVVADDGVIVVPGRIDAGGRTLGEAREVADCRAGGPGDREGRDEGQEDDDERAALHTGLPVRE